MGPIWSAFLAQPLASVGIAVLQIGGPLAPKPFHREDELELTNEYGAALESAAQHLTKIGLVDGSKVGLMGHSATGRIVERELIVSEFPFAAAIEGDYADDNYVQAALYGWSHTVGNTAPFGTGIKQWLEESPAFNAERVRTPLQLLLYSASEGNGTLLWHWEMFSRLQYLEKPVELYVIPDIAHGSHLVQNPRQLLALQSRAMDWWCFWLLDQEFSSVSKEQQYSEWRRLRVKHEEDIRRPRPPRYIWNYMLH
jgi:dipeptidyl aminopeptidase/acylaminoacyl peptidase